MNGITNLHGMNKKYEETNYCVFDYNRKLKVTKDCIFIHAKSGLKLTFSVPKMMTVKRQILLATAMIRN